MKWSTHVGDFSNLLKAFIGSNYLGISFAFYQSGLGVSTCITFDDSISVCAKNILTNYPEQHFRRMFSIWFSKFYAVFNNPNQFLLDWGIGLVVFSTDCYMPVYFFDYWTLLGIGTWIWTLVLCFYLNKVGGDRRIPNY